MIDQGSASFSADGWIVNIVGDVGHRAFVATIQPAAAVPKQP